MARNLDPKCKQCRREGEKLFLKGERCFTPKCPIIKRNYPPGQHGEKGSPRLSSYAKHLREKQKVKRMYRLLERQFAQYLKRALRKTGNTAELFLQMLECRLDNVVFRLGLADSRAQARQLVNHGHVTVTGRPVSIPSFAVRPGDTIAVKDSSRAKTVFTRPASAGIQRTLPAWLDGSREKLEGSMLHLPSGDELNLGLQVPLIIEYYAR